jgi:hypothetical protein
MRKELRCQIGIYQHQIKRLGLRITAKRRKPVEQPI